VKNLVMWHRTFCTQIAECKGAKYCHSNRCETTAPYSLLPTKNLRQINCTPYFIVAVFSHTSMLCLLLVCFGYYFYQKEMKMPMVVGFGNLKRLNRWCWWCSKKNT